MSLRLKIAVLAGLALLVAAVAALVALREPQYQGRTLTNWLEIYRWSYHGLYFKAAADIEQNELARAAIRQCGPRIIPRLLAMMHREDTRTQWGRDLGQSFGLRYISGEEDRVLGAFGLHALGPDAASAIPGLIKLIEREPELAALALSGMGAEARAAVPALERGLTNGNPNATIELLNAIVKIEPDPARVVPLLLAEMTNGYPGSAGAACQLLGGMGDRARIALPELNRLVDNDPSLQVRDLARHAIEKLDARSEKNFTRFCERYSQPVDLAAVQAWGVNMMNSVNSARGRQEFELEAEYYPVLQPGFFGHETRAISEPRRPDAPRRVVIATGPRGASWGLIIADPGATLRDPTVELVRLGDGVWAFRDKR